MLKQKSSWVLNFKHIFVTSLISNHQNSHSTQVAEFCIFLPGCSNNSILFTKYIHLLAEAIQHDRYSSEICYSENCT